MRRLERLLLLHLLVGLKSLRLPSPILMTQVTFKRNWYLHHRAALTAQDLKKDMLGAGDVYTHQMSHHARLASSLLPSGLTQPRTMQWGILGNIVPCKLHRQKRKFHLFPSSWICMPVSQCLYAA